MDAQRLINLDRIISLAPTFQSMTIFDLHCFQFISEEKLVWKPFQPTSSFFSSIVLLVNFEFFFDSLLICPENFIWSTVEYSLRSARMTECGLPHPSRTIFQLPPCSGSMLFNMNKRTERQLHTFRLLSFHFWFWLHKTIFLASSFQHH